ncbi:serine hydrolase domain-containing protein [Ramlibacter sp. AN1133]|uniref:serine hydrolase domain-containing protein n=1 Tax=Ramlibacter sp. AN1133 TaxID=3133429 RepID=UPI0030BE26E8
MPDFTPVDAALRRRIASEELVGVSYAVLRGGASVARNCIGWADREAQVPLREDHLFRAFSNTKLVTSCAALRLVEQGRIGLDDPVAEYIPALGALRALRPGATALDDTEPLREPVRLRHLLTHTAGFTYAFLQPNAPIAKASMAAGVADPALTLAQMMEALAGLPLLFQPGADWNYSVATDVMGRVIEVVAGETLDRHFQRHVFEPLGMHDTFFFVPPDKQGRLARMYIGDLRDPGKRGLRRADHLPSPGAYLQPAPRLNAGGGLVTSLDDFGRLLAVLAGGGAPLLRPQTLPLVFGNQLPPGMWIGFPHEPRTIGRGHSYAGSVTVERSDADPSSRPGDLQWGGLAGTKWWIWPAKKVCVALMTQRYMGSDLPFWPEFKALVRAALEEEEGRE